MSSTSHYKSNFSAWMPFGLWRIDMYFVRFYLKAFFLILAALTALVAIGDIFQHFDDFVVMSRRDELDSLASVVIFVRYYCSFVPQLIFQYMLPAAMLLSASITATTSFSGPRGNNEYIVIRSAGIPVLRSFFPLIFPALMVAATFQATRDYYLPSMVRESSAIFNRLKSRIGKPTSVSMIGAEGFQSAAIGWFDPSNVAHNLIVEVRDPEAFHRGDASRGDNDFVSYRAAAARLEPSATGGYQWVPLERGRRQSFTRFTRREQEWLDPISTSMTPAMIERQTLGDAVSTWNDLLLMRDDNAGAKFEMNWRIADPLACGLLIMWGTGLCMGRMLRGRGAGYIHSITISMVAAGLFYALRLTGKSLWESGALTPTQGVWYPLAAASLVALAIAWWMEP